MWAPADASRTYPTVYVLHAHMRSARWWFNVDPFVPSYPEVIDELAPEAVVVLVDGWTDVGGGQWIGEHRVVPARRGRAVRRRASIRRTGCAALQGKSSGGYGALVNAMERPDLFHAVAAHAPDALFEVTLAHGLPGRGARAARAVRRLARCVLGIVRRARVARRRAPRRADGGRASRSATATLPFDSEGRVLPGLRAVARARPGAARERLRRGGAVLARRVARRRAPRRVLPRPRRVGAARRAARRRACRRIGCTSSSSTGGHSGMSHRYPLSLAWLVERLRRSLAVDPRDELVDQRAGTRCSGSGRGRSVP